ncbi:MAG TPA: hypothetical protein ENI33_03300 [Thermoplasmatales archaeon]|nr:hypothetical protein [Thermoplasmatales archaeon]
MEGKTKCPYCKQNVVVEVPDGSRGIQKTKCPNCGMNIKVEVTEREETVETPIHPLLKQKSSRALNIAGSLLIITSVLGIIMGSSFLLFENIATGGEGIYEGRVIDIENNPVKDASIYLADDEIMKIGKTDERGYFSINMTTGKHKILIEKNGYISKKATIGVFPFKPILREKFLMERGEGIKEEKKLTAIIFDTMPIIFSLVLILSIPPLIGGIFCFMKRYDIVVIICAIFGIFSIGFFIGTILSIVALFIVITHRNEFATI